MRNICSYFGNHYRIDFSQHVTEMQKYGFNTLCLCVTEGDFRWNEKRVHWMVDHARGRGMEVWLDPWGVGKVFDGEAMSSGNGCLLDGTTQRIIGDWLYKATRTNADAIFWDNPKVRCGHPRCYNHFVNIMHILTTLTHRECKDNYVSLSAIDHIGLIDEFDQIASLPHVDGVGTDPYCLGDPGKFPESYVHQWASDILAITNAHGKRPHIWVQGFRLPSGWHQLPVRNMKQARLAGIEDIGFWSFRATDATSDLTPDESELVWFTYGEAIKWYMIQNLGV